LRITIDQSFPLEGYQDALARLEHGEQLGKIVLTHEGS
jgi:NADPH:quinone reductase-like Zn-dependent oxidoreductase